MASCAPVCAFIAPATRRALIAALALGAIVFKAAPATADDGPQALGTIRVHAWLEPPRMPPIALTRGPLQQIIEWVEPEAIRTAVYAWEDAITRHRRLLRAAAEAIEEMERHYRHQIVIRPGDSGALRLRLRAERERMEARFEQGAQARETRLRLQESGILGRLRRSGAVSSRGGSAAAHLVAAEIAFARQQDTGRVLLRRWRHAHQEWAAGNRADEPARPLPFLGGVIGALERVGDQAPDRLTRERSAQLLAVAHQWNLDAESAIRVLEAALRTRASWSMKAELENRLGDLRLERRRFAAAARAYGGVHKDAGSWYVRARLGLAWSRHRQGDDDGALAAVQEVREHLDGVFDGSARALATEADRLYAQLLADGGRELPLPGLGPHLQEAVRQLRARQAELLPLSVRDGGEADERLGAIAGRIVPIRACYRRFLRNRPGTSARGVIALSPDASARLVTVSVSQRRFHGCLQDALRGLRSPPSAVPAVVVLDLQPEAPTS